MPKHALSALLLLNLIALPVLAQSLPTASPEEVGLSSERLGRIGKAMQGEIEAKRMPGSVVAIARKGKLAYLESQGPMQKDSIFRVYSMTKPFVAVAAMILAEEGKLVLTDNISKYLPAFAKMQVSVPKVDASGRLTWDTVAATREITVLDLLRHTSGLAYGEITANAPVKEAYLKAGVLQADMPYDARGMTPAEEVERLSKAPLAHNPGEIWEYGLSMDVLGRVVEVASGMRLSDFLEKRIFKPLKMNETGFYVPKEKLSRVAAPLAIDPATGQPNHVIDVSAQPKNASGGAGAVSTISDYLRFAQMLANGGQLDGVRILSRTTIQEMTSDQLGKIKETGLTPGELLMGVKGYTFGLGFMVREQNGLAPIPGNAGEFMWAGAAGTFFFIDPKEQLVAVLMTQTPGPSRSYYRKFFKQLVYQAIDDN